MSEKDHELPQALCFVSKAFSEHDRAVMKVVLSVIASLVTSSCQVGYFDVRKFASSLVRVQEQL